MIGIIDYGVGNLASLSFALDDLKLNYLVSKNVSQLEQCDRLILPGVGNAQYAIERLIETQLNKFILNWRKPLLGICLGMQLLYESSEESKVPLLGLIPGRLKQFNHDQLAKTHMGWNKISNGELMYFVHSYYAPINDFTVSTSDYGIEFSSIVQIGLVTGVQFHPEKSGQNGLFFLKEILEDVLC